MKYFFLAIALCSCFCFYSCSNEEEATCIPSNHLSEIAKESSNKMSRFSICMDNLPESTAAFTRSSSDDLNLQMVDYVIEACDLLSHTNLSEVCQQYGINETIFDALEYYYNHAEDENVMEQLQIMYSSLKDQEFELVFDSYYLAMEYLKHNGLFSVTRGYSLETEFPVNDFEEMEMSSWKVVGCALAFTGVMVTVATAASVTGGASLALFCLSYATGIGGMITSCSPE